MSSFEVHMQVTRKGFAEGYSREYAERIPYFFAAAILDGKTAEVEQWLERSLRRTALNWPCENFPFWIAVWRMVALHARDLRDPMQFFADLLNYKEMVEGRALDKHMAEFLDEAERLSVLTMDRRF